MRPKFLAASEKQLQSLFCGGKISLVISKQQLSDKFLNGFHVCEETSKVEHAAIHSETGVNAIWQVLFCLMEHDAEEGGEQ